MKTVLLDLHPTKDYFTMKRELEYDDLMAHLIEPGLAAEQLNEKRRIQAGGEREIAQGGSDEKNG